MENFFDFKNGVNNNDLDKIKNLLLNDNIVIFPTETVYGIGANIYSDKALNKIFEAKGRPNDNPLIVHISKFEMLNDIAINIDDVSKTLMMHFWPGPLTIVLPKHKNVSNIITANMNTVAVRMPSNDIALKIISACGVPLAAPSANISSRPSGTNISDIFNELEGKVAGIVDGGDTDIGLESTVVQVKKNIVHILRPGKISKEDIVSLGFKIKEEHLNRKVEDDEKVSSPGVKYKHYAPRAKAILIYGKNNNKVMKKINELIAENSDKKIIVISKNKYNVETLSMGNSLSEISKNLFSTLRKADKEDVDLILIEGVESSNIGTAIMNRLIKACDNNFIEL